MRCPKCGFISFDHVETCKKCHKHLGDTTAEVNGTTYDASPYLFLTIATTEKAVALAARQPEEQQVSVFTDETVFATEKEAAANPEDSSAEDERYEIEFDGFDEELDEQQFEEASGFKEFILEEESPDEEALSDEPPMDFGDLDISDLTPPTPQFSPEKGHVGLKDLDVAGLDLGTSAKLASGTAAGKRFLPSVKTGTALDKFDVDLGELFPDNKE